MRSRTRRLLVNVACVQRVACLIRAVTALTHVGSSVATIHLSVASDLDIQGTILQWRCLDGIRYVLVNGFGNVEGVLANIPTHCLHSSVTFLSEIGRILGSWSASKA